MQTKNFWILTPHFVFFLMIHTYYVILGVIFPLFLAQNFRTKVWTAQKNLLQSTAIHYNTVEEGRQFNFASSGTSEGEGGGEEMSVANSVTLWKQGQRKY